MCKYGRKCKIKNCPLKHEEEEEKPECLNYKQGFCYNGKSCRLRHVKRQPEECPALFDFNQSIAEGKRSTHVLTKVLLINNCTKWNNFVRECTNVEEAQDSSTKPIV